MIAVVVVMCGSVSPTVIILFTIILGYDSETRVGTFRA